MSSKHSVEKVTTSLEIDENIALHEKGWKVQRVGWGFIFFFVLLAAFGLFGNGIFSRRMKSMNNVEVEFQRFFRQEARMELKIRFKGRETHSPVVSFPNEYLKQFRIESILPEPKENMVLGERISYWFAGNGPMQISFYLVPQSTGNVKGELLLNNERFLIDHLIYP
jgi:hypothetical protein